MFSHFSSHWGLGDWRYQVDVRVRLIDFLFFFFYVCLLICVTRNRAEKLESCDSCVFM